MDECINNGQYNIPSFLNSTTKIVASTAIGYFLIAKLSLLVFVTEINILPFFPAIGFAIAAVLLLGRKAIIGVIIGCFIFSIGLYKNDFQNAATFQELIKPLILCIIRPIIAGLNAFLVCYLTQLWCKSKYPFDNEKNVLFFAFASLLGTFISVSICFIPLAMTSYFSLDNCTLIWSNMFRGNTLGIILFTPFVLSWLHDTKKITQWYPVKKAEAVVLIITALSLSIYIFESHANNESILFFLLIWAACRFGMKIITLISVIIAIIAIYCTGHHMGGFIFGGWNNDFFMLQLFLFVNMISVLFLKAILEEKEKEKDKLKLKEIQLEKNNSTLNERIKELRCLSDISEIISNNTLLISEKLEACVQIIPTALQFPEIANCRIRFQKEEFLSEKYQENDWQLNQKIIINGEEYGWIEVGYFNAAELEKETIFLSEEIKLLETLSDIISKALETKIAEEKLIKSEEKFRSIYENSLDIYFKKDLDGTILEIGPSVDKHLLQKRESMIGKNIRDYYYDITDVDRFYEIILKEEQIIDYQERFINATGESVYLSVNAKLVYDSDGKPIYVEGTRRNISERILNEKQLQEATEKIKESEEKYRSIFENMQDIYYMHTLDGKLLDISPSVEKNLKFKREEMIGRNTIDFHYDQSRQNELREKITKDGFITDELIQFVTASGEPVYFSVNCKVIYDQNGQKKHVEGSMRNIDERINNQKQLIDATEKIKESEEKFRSIYENMEDVYFLHELDGTMIDISPSAEKVFQIKKEEFIGTKAQIFHNTPARHEELQGKLQKYGSIHDEEVEFLTATGETIYFSASAKLIMDPIRNRKLVEGTMRNINERIVNQKQLLEASEKIKESEEKFRSIYENMQDVYFLHELDGTILDVSPSAEKSFQMKREEFIGVNAQSLQSNPARYDEIMAKIHKYGFVNDQEVEFMTATGESIYYSINARLINKNDCNCTLVEGTMRNINERIINQKKLFEATEKIKKSEEEFRAIFESFEDVYFRTSLDGYIQNISPSIEKIFKYTREDIIGSSSAIMYLHAKDRDNLVNVLKKKGHVTDFETIFKNKENINQYVSINAHFINDVNDNPMYIEGTIRDISQRKKNELEIEIANEVIKESEKKYRTIFESVRDVFFRASAKDHTIIDISPSCTYFNIQQDEIIGKPIEGFYLNPADRQAVLKELMQNGEIKEYDAKFLIKNKTYTVSINSKIAYDQNNEPEFLIGSFRDISARIQAEENLKISEAKFRSIYENFEDVYYKTELDGTVIDLSPSFEINFKMKRSDVIGNAISFTYCNPDDRETMIDLLKKNGHVSDFDTRYIDGEGNIVSFSINAHIVYDSNKKPLYVEGTMRNINERSIMQEEMLAKNRTLEFQNTELEQFAYIASHDLQEPLITVIHCIELLQEGLYENLDDDQKQYLEFINSSTSRMQLLVKGLLDYSRIGKERKASVINCNEIVANVLADMNVSLKESNAIIEYENLPVIEGYSTEIRQLFQNMISNANKYRKKDQHPKIKIAAVQKENNWLFSIQDNGIGIEEQDKDKVFVIFKRLHNRNEYQGTGIGLSHCKKIVEHHKGKIWVESKYNQGSTFKWTIPIELN